MSLRLLSPLHALPAKIALFSVLAVAAGAFVTASSGAACVIETPADYNQYKSQSQIFDERLPNGSWNVNNSSPCVVRAHVTVWKVNEEGPHLFKAQTIFSSSPTVDIQPGQVVNIAAAVPGCWYQTDLGAGDGPFGDVNGEIVQNGNVCTANNNATCTVNAPSVVAPGQQFTASFQLTNTGDSWWFNQGLAPYRLGTKNPIDNATFGEARIGINGFVKPGESQTLSFTATAPSTPGTYNMDWEMLREGLYRFGNECHKTITVVPSAAACIDPNFQGPVGPLPYLSFQNWSPYRCINDWVYFHNETLNDQQFNSPGLTAETAVGVKPYTGNPDNTVDSVDGDDGNEDGQCTGPSCNNLGFGAPATTPMVLAFSPSLPGGLPTYVGIVWTDGGTDSGIQFRAYDANNNVIEEVNGVSGDGVYTQTTAEDRFFGAVNRGGIRKITVQQTGGSQDYGFDMDHIQYGRRTVDAVPQCRDSNDNDNDGRVDAQDPGCHSDGNVNNSGSYEPDFNDEARTFGTCLDGQDNDSDATVDAADPDCHTDGNVNNPQSFDARRNESSVPQCRDGIDNDGDGAIDFPNDFSCSSANDNDESLPRSACQDTQDNDGDGVTDAQDPGCHTDGNANNPGSYNAQDNDEFNAAASSSSSSMSSSSMSSSSSSAPSSSSSSSVASSSSSSVASSSSSSSMTSSSSSLSSSSSSVSSSAPSSSSSSSSSAPSSSSSSSLSSSSMSSSSSSSSSAVSSSSSSSSRSSSSSSSSVSSSSSSMSSSSSSAMSSSSSSMSSSSSVMSSSSSSSATAVPQCRDNNDNDNDGRVDAQDPGCHSDGNANNSGSYDSNWNNESRTFAGCGDGFDNDNDGMVDNADADCHTDGNVNNSQSFDARRNEVSQTAALEQCRDGIDNDGDGKVDAQDPSCHTDGNGSNSQSYNPYRSEFDPATQQPPVTFNPFTGSTSNATNTTNVNVQNNNTIASNANANANANPTANANANPNVTSSPTVYLAGITSDSGNGQGYISGGNYGNGYTGTYSGGGYKDAGGYKDSGSIQHIGLLPQTGLASFTGALGSAQGMLTPLSGAAGVSSVLVTMLGMLGITVGAGIGRRFFFL